MVVRQGLIFKAGSYPQRGLTMTPDEVKVMAANFQVVPVDLDHKTTLKGIDSKLGHCTAVTADDKGHLFGRLEIPEWLNDLVGKDANGNEIPIKVSSTILKKDKRLSKVALTDNPIIDDAAVFAAFSAAHPDEVSEIEFMGSVSTNDSETVTIDGGEVVEFAPRKKFKTYDGQSVIQAIHDNASRHGAICSPSEPTAEFHSSQELASIQQMHDIAVTGGAVCRVLKEGQVAMPSCFSNEENQMSQETNTLGIVDKMIEFAKTLGAKTETKVEAPLAPPVTPPATPVAAELSDDTKTKIADLERDLAAANAAIEASKAVTEAAQEASVHSQATQFAEEVIKRGAEIPANREACIATFAQAIRDDNTSQVEVTFGKNQKGGRVDALKALYNTRKPLELTQEQLDAGTTAALLSDDGTSVSQGIDIEKVKERAKKLAEEQNRKGRK